MQRKSPKWIEDIRACASFIIETTAQMELADYRANQLVKSAVERNFEVIGEAINRLARHDAETAARLGDYPRIIAFRNILIHGYDLVDNDQVWKVIKENLPALKERAEVLLRETPQG